MKYDVLHNFISPVTGRLADIFQFPSLQHNYIWVGDANNRPVPTPLSEVITLPPLAQGMIWIGNADNVATATQTINLNNLPALNVVNIGDYPTPLPQIYAGTSSGVPEISNSLAEAIADIFAINAKLLLGNFIMGDALVHLTWPGAQFLVDLTDGMLKKTGKLMQHAVSGVDYVDVVNPIENSISVWANAGAGTPKMLINTGITVDDQNRMSGINTVNTVFVIASDQITSNTSVFGLNNVGTRQIQIYDQWNGPGRLTKSVNLIGPPQLAGNVNLVMPTLAGATNQVLTDTGADINNNRTLAFRNILPDGLDNNLLAKGVDANNNPIFVNAPLAQNKIWLGDVNSKPAVVANIIIDNLPGLTTGKVWQGNNAGRPVEASLDFAPNNAEYVLNTLNNNLPNAQNLSLLITGLTKVTTGTGKLSTALVGVDYPSVASVTAAQAAADAAAAEATAASAAAAAAPAAGAALAATYFTAQMFPYLPVPSPLGQGSQISALIAAAAATAASASSSASSAQSTANTAISRLDNLSITLQGDITGSGNLSNPITTSFIQNPAFYGNESLTLPFGTTGQRSGSPTKGMLRLNTTI